MSAEIGGRGRCGDEQRAPRRLGQPRDAPGERALDGRRDRQRRLRRGSPATASASPASSISASGLPPVARNSRSALPSGTCPSRSSGEQGLGCVEVETGQLERGQPRVGERRRLAGADADDDRDGIGEQPPSGEEQRLGGRLVEPLGVVHEHAQRPLLGGRRRACRASRRRSRAARRSRPARARARRAGRPPAAPEGASTCSSTGRSSSSRPANGIDASPSTPRAARTRISRALRGGVREQRALADARLAAHERALRSCRRARRRADARSLRAPHRARAAWPEYAPGSAARAVQVGPLM